MAMTGLNFINAIAPALGLSDLVQRVIIEADVRGVVKVLVVRVADESELSAIIDVLNTGEVSIVDASAVQPAFVHEIASDEQKVRYEAPTLDGLQRLLADERKG